MWEYTGKVKDHFLNPRNVGTIENPDAEAEVGNLACGDALKLQLKLDAEGKIADVKFQTFGCASAIASSSALTEMVKGKSLDEAAKITDQDIADYLGGLPEQKMHCSVMGREALEAAIANYRGEAPPTAVTEEEGRIVCKCFAVTDEKIRRAIREHNLTTVEEVTNYTKAGGGCGACIPEIEGLIREVRGEMAAAPPAAPVRPATLTNIQKMKMIEETIEREIRPALRGDGGDIDLIDIDGNRVIVALRGTCTDCAAAGFTLTSLVEGKLREFVAEDLKVELKPS